MTMEIVTSPQNPRLKVVRKLATRRGRQREGAFAVEGEDVVRAGVDRGWTARFLVYAGDNPPDALFQTAMAGIPVVAIDEALVASLTGLAHPPRVIGVFELPDDVTFADTRRVAGEPAVYLDGIRDPGNVGTILRSACALGIARIGLGPGTADPFGPKATRASMGAVFAARFDNVGSIDEFAAEGQLVVALDADADQPLHHVDLGSAPVLCVGGERVGLGDAVRSRADFAAVIPHVDGAESLNAATAASIAMYEWRRQRGGA